MRSFVFLLTLALISLPVKPVLAQSDPDYQIEVENNTICSFINSNHVNIRRSPNNRSPVVTRLNRGDVVRAVRQQGNWVEIAARDSGRSPSPYSPLQGWVLNQYINGCSEDQFDRWRP